MCAGSPLTDLSARLIKQEEGSRVKGSRSKVAAFMNASLEEDECCVNKKKIHWGQDVAVARDSVGHNGVSYFPPGWF